MSQYKPKPVPAPSQQAKREIAAVAAAPYGLPGFKRFAKLLGLKIHRYQGYMLGLYFAGVTELVILIPKKNGKTTLLAALALYHLLKTDKAECVIGASSRDQATILFQQAANLVVDAGLQAVFDVKGGYRVIKHQKGRVRVLAADANTADGVIPTLALVDELHRHPSGALYGVFFDGLIDDAQMVTISTAGADIDSPLGKLLERARTLPAETDVRCRTYRSANGAFALVEWALLDDDDPHNMTTVKKANPAPWHTPKTLRRRHDSPSMTDGQWFRFACGLWTAGEENPITASQWDAARVDIGKISPGERVWLGVHPGDAAWIGFAAHREGNKVAVRAESLGQDRSGVKIERRLRELYALYEVMEVAYRTEHIRSAEISEDDGLPMMQTPYSAQRLRIISATFNRVLNSGELMHDGDPELRSSVLATMAKETLTGWGYVLGTRSAGLIAVANAVHQATAYDPEPFVGVPSVVV